MTANATETESFLRLILDSTIEGFYSIDTHGYTTACNAAFLHMLGYTSADEVIGQKVHRQIHRFHSDGSIYNLDECPIYLSATKGLKKHIRNELFFRKDGTSFPADYQTLPFVEDNILKGAICTFMDISEWVKKEETLTNLQNLTHDYAERIHLALNSGAVVGTWVWDILNDEVIGDERFVSTFFVNTPSQPIPFSKIAEHIHPDDLPKVKEHINETLANGTPYRTEYRIRKHTVSKKNDSSAWLWVEASGVVEKDEQGKPFRFPGILIDIDARKQIEKDLRALNDTLEVRVAERTAQLAAKEARLRTIFETSYQFQGLLTLEGILLDANTTSLSAINASLEDVIGKPFWATPWFSETPDMSDQVRELIPLVAKGETLRREITLILPTGQRAFDFSLRPIRNETGQVIAIVPEAVELTGQRLAQQELRELRENLTQWIELQTKDLVDAKEQAEAANFAKTEFLANMSHEIRTPMNAIMGLANILALSSPLTPKQQEFIQTLQLSANALLSLINDLLDIAKIESQSVELECTPFHVPELLNEVVSMMAVRAKEKHLNIESIIQCGCLNERLFMGDPGRLRQILLNLCSNAIKFTEKGNISITVSCKPTADAEVEDLILSVADSGIGIAPDKLDTIFYKFVQADSSINRRYGGTGLGLAITKTLIELMSGTITVKSKPNEGSTFTVTLPLKRTTMSASNREKTDLAAPLDETSTAPANGPRILLVEDNPANVLVATCFLENFGYTYDVAGTGIEALEFFQGTKKYAAVLMDVQMPGMNGYEATLKIRELEEKTGQPRIPILGMTAHALAGDRERCLSVGMDDYIAKPFNPEKLKEQISQAIIYA
ncbi:MAG: ATP-binding protein [Pseudomonadota bacterium]